MIETEEQRRWWFATHPEYSWSNRGGRGGGIGARDDGHRDYYPKDVDAYVDQQLGYERGPVAKQFESFKRGFGTGGDWRKGGQDLRVSASDRANGWLNAAGFHAGGGGLIVPTWPTAEDLFQLPTAVARELIRSLDAWVQNYPFLFDPNALERHHGLIRECVEYFAQCGLDIEESVRLIRAAKHRLKPDGLHTGEGPGGDWNTEWKKFIEKHPAENTPKRQRQIRDKLQEMERDRGIDKEILLPPKRRRR